MSDYPREDEVSLHRAAVQRQAAEEVVTQGEIDDVLGDPSLSLGEREARLADLRQRLLDAEHEHGDEEYAPLQARIMDALSMLAEGGHDYDGPRQMEGEPHADGASAPDIESS